MKTVQLAALIRYLWVATMTAATSLQVFAQPTLTALTRTTNGNSSIFELTALVSPGIKYTLEISLNLDSWFDSMSATAIGPSLKMMVTNISATDPSYLFFRLVAETFTGTTVGMEMIPAGSFGMGDTFNDVDQFFGERPVHPVFVSAFYMDKYEVTKARWNEVFDWSRKHGYRYENPGDGKATNHPVQSVSWYDAVKWSNARSQKEGRVPAYYTDAALTQVYKVGVAVPYVRWDLGYRLPTEAEWEKAARGGESGHRFPWTDSDTISYSRANYRSDSFLPFPYDVSPSQGYHPTYAVGDLPYTSPVGSFSANGYGLYDLAGNVKEWCWDWFAIDWFSTGPQSDPHGPRSGTYAVLRGGGWDLSALNCRVARRYDYSEPTGSSNDTGFRCVLPSPQP